MEENTREIEIEGFPLDEAKKVVEIYVCAQCEGGLRIAPTDWTIALEDNVLFDVVCPECGSVELVGRISKTTVAIRNEHGVNEYYPAIRTLENLWGELLEKYRRERIKPVTIRPGETKTQASLRELGF